MLKATQIGCVYVTYWWTDVFALFGPEWTSLKRFQWFYHKTQTPSTHDGNLVKVFLMKRKQNGDVYVWNFWLLFVWVPMYQQSKSAFLLVTLNFELEQMDISNRHSPSDFAHSFVFYCLSNFGKGINLSSKACVLLRKHPIYTSKRDRWIPLWWAKFELEFLLTIFI